MKPILILKVNVGEEAGGILNLPVLYNDNNYFRDLAEDFCSSYPMLNDPSIVNIIYK